MSICNHVRKPFQFVEGQSRFEAPRLEQRPSYQEVERLFVLKERARIMLAHSKSFCHPLSEFFGVFD
jgi:hypothetical protein